MPQIATIMLSDSNVSLYRCLDLPRAVEAFMFFAVSYWYVRIRIHSDLQHYQVCTRYQVRTQAAVRAAVLTLHTGNTADGGNSCYCRLESAGRTGISPALS